MSIIKFYLYPSKEKYIKPCYIQNHYKNPILALTPLHIYLKGSVHSATAPSTYLFLCLTNNTIINIIIITAPNIIKPILITLGAKNDNLTSVFVFKSCRV